MIGPASLLHSLHLVLSGFVSCFLVRVDHWKVVYLVYPCIPYDATFGSCVLGSGCLQPPLACWPLHSGGGGADWKTSKPLTITRSASWVSVLWWNILSRGGFRPPFLMDLMGSPVCQMLARRANGYGGDPHFWAGFVYKLKIPSDLRPSWGRKRAEYHHYCFCWLNEPQLSNMPFNGYWDWAIIIPCPVWVKIF